MHLHIKVGDYLHMRTLIFLSEAIVEEDIRGKEAMGVEDGWHGLLAVL